MGILIFSIRMDMFGMGMDNLAFGEQELVWELVFEAIKVLELEWIEFFSIPQPWKQVCLMSTNI